MSTTFFLLFPIFPTFSCFFTLFFINMAVVVVVAAVIHIFRLLHAINSILPFYFTLRGKQVKSRQNKKSEPKKKIMIVCAHIMHVFGAENMCNL